MGQLDRRLVPLERAAASRRAEDDHVRADVAALTDDERAALVARLDPLYALLAKELLRGEVLTPPEILDLEAAYGGVVASVRPAVVAWADRRLDHLPTEELEARMRAFLAAWERQRAIEAGGAPCAG